LNCKIGSNVYLQKTYHYWQNLINYKDLGSSKTKKQKKVRQAL